MNTRSQQRDLRRKVSVYLAALVAALAAILLGITSSASAAVGAETRIRASSGTIEVSVMPPQGETPGQRLGNEPAGPGIVVSTGVASKYCANAERQTWSPEALENFQHADEYFDQLYPDAPDDPILLLFKIPYELTIGGAIDTVTSCTGVGGDASAGGCAFNAITSVPGLNLAKGLKFSDEIVDAFRGSDNASDAAHTTENVADAAKTGARTCLKSFVGTTLVLMADGSKKPIEDIEVGDRVVATDPETGDRVTRGVTRVWVHDDQVFDLVVGSKTIATTEDHLFWSVTDRRFEHADELASGEVVLGDGGRQLNVGGFRLETERTALAYNLSIAGVHTYHVGESEILVHNDCTPSPFRGTNMTDEESLTFHYGRHGSGRSLEQYAEDARTFAESPAGTTSSVILRDGTTGIKYRTPGSPGGILDGDGNLITFWYD